MEKEFESEFRFGLKQRVFNWNMRVARDKLGLTQKELGKLVGLRSTTINHYETLRNFPTPMIQGKIAKILKTPAESLFPEWLKEFRLKRVPAAIEEKSLSIKQLMKLRIEKAIPLRLVRPEILMVEDHRREIDRNFLNDQIKEVLQTLPRRQREILELKFGFENGEEMTFGEIGQKIGISSTRVGQIKAKTIGDLRRRFRNSF